MPVRPRGRGSRAAVAEHTLRQERVLLGVIAAIVVLYTVANVVGYRDTYPTAAERERFAAAFGDNVALRLFYGLPHDLATVAGYVEFRVVGILSVFLAAWAVFAAVRALRGEEDAGRFELILAAPGAPGRGDRGGPRRARDRVPHAVGCDRARPDRHRDGVRRYLARPVAAPGRGDRRAGGPVRRARSAGVP